MRGGITDNGTLAFDYSGAQSISNVISGSGGVEIAGGSVTLGVTAIPDTYTGATVIDSGATLVLANTAVIRSSSGVTADGTLDVSQNGVTVISTLSGSGAVLLGAGVLTLSNASSTFAGVISGDGTVEVLGGTETLTGANTYTAQTFIAAGATLALSGSGSISASKVYDPGTLNISGLTNGGTSIVSLTGTGGVNLGANTLTLTNAAHAPFSGVISGSGGGLTLAGGTETLTGVNTYTGATTINSGATLALAGSGSIAASSGVAANGTFDISGAGGGASRKPFGLRLGRPGGEHPDADQCFGELLRDDFRLGRPLPRRRERDPERDQHLHERHGDRRRRDAGLVRLGLDRVVRRGDPAWNVGHLRHDVGRVDHRPGQLGRERLGRAGLADPDADQRQRSLGRLLRRDLGPGRS